MLTATACVARGDDLKISGFWINDVQILSLSHGNLCYRAITGGEVSKPLAEIEGVHLTAHPQYEQAMALLETGDKRDARAAVGLLERAATKARDDWSKGFIGQALWRAYAQAGRYENFLDAYLDLVDGGVDVHFLVDPPVSLIAQAGDDTKHRLVPRLEAALAKANDATRPLLSRLLKAAQVVSPTEPAANTNVPVPQKPAETPAPAVTLVAVASTHTVSAAVLPIKIADSPATQLLRQGDFAKAIEQTQRDIEQPGNLAVDLYLHGIALLYQAEQTADVDTYKDAGLSFMRVLVYFPQSNFAGRNLVGGSLLELAYIHSKLGRAEKAMELYDRAAAELDGEADPNLSQRLQALRPSPPERENP